MFSALSLARRKYNASKPRAGGPDPIWAVYAALSLLLVAYLISLTLRSPNQTSILVDGRMVVGFEFIVTALCLARGLLRRRDRAIPLILGAALLSWTLGDFVLTYQSMGSQTPPTPSLADACYLAFYPLAYVGLVLATRREVGRLGSSAWMDGALAGAGAAAVCACFAFNTILHSVGGTPLAVATNLSYPVGDVLLLTLVFGAAATMPGRPKRQWALLGTALTVIAVGDTFNRWKAPVASPSSGAC